MLSVCEHQVETRLGYIALYVFVRYLTFVDAAMPDVKQCCRSQGIPENCVTQICDVDSPFSDFQSYFTDISDCGVYMPEASQCIADERDFSSCCQSKKHGVTQECFSMCDGSSAQVTTAGNWSYYGNFMVCIDMDGRAVYECARESYTTTPGKPREVLAPDANENGVVISWQPTQINPELVTSYEIFYGPINGRKFKRDAAGYEKAVTENLEYRVTGLSPNTHYEVYVISVASNSKRSQPVRSTFSTKREPPVIEATKSVVTATPRTYVYLNCYVKLFGQDTIDNIETWWERSAGGQSTKVEGRRFRISKKRYPKKDDPIVLVTYLLSLTILQVREEEFGEYTCHAKNSVGASQASFNLERRDVEVQSTPFDLEQCCADKQMPSNCMGLCRFNLFPKKALPYDMTTLQCSNVESLKVMSCMMKDMQDRFAACCMRQGLSEDCLDICDGKTSVRTSCTNQLHKLTQCEIEFEHGLPAQPNNLKLASRDSSSINLRWDGIRQASEYIVYYSPNSEQTWQKVHSTEPKILLSDVDHSKSYKVFVFSKNEAGLSRFGAQLQVT